MSTSSPLLVGGSNSEAPTLGGSQMEPEQSPLERLIAKSTSEQAAQTGSFYLDDEPVVTSAPATFVAPISLTQSVGSSVTTLVAGSLCLLQAGLIWASFLSESWFDTLLRVSIDWQRNYFPSLDGAVDQVLESTTLASLLQTFMGADQHWASMILVVSSLFVPCLCMILCPAWAVGDHQGRFAIAIRSKPPTCEILRQIFEFLLRLSLLVFFTLCILDIGTSSIEVVNNHTKLHIANRTRGGLVCYTLGMSCALSVVVILRMARAKQNGYNDYTPSPSSTSEVDFPTTRQSTATPRAPPSRAFRLLPWRIGATGEAEQEQRQPLLFDEEMDNTLEAARGTVERLQIESGMQPERRGLSFFKKVILYEMGVAATVLWLPALFLPLFQVNFGGFVSSFMEHISISVRFFEVPTLIWQRGVTAGTDHWMLIALGAVLLSFVYVLPLLATILAICVWRTTSTTSLLCRHALQFIHPCLCGIVFVISLLFAVPALEPVGVYLLNEESSGFCSKFQQATDAACLTIQGQSALGIWFLLAQSLSLEIFVLLTIRWNK